MTNSKKVNEEKDWTIYDGQSAKGQKIIYKLFRRFYWNTVLSFYRHNPEWFLKLRWPSKVHYNQKLGIGWVEFHENHKIWMIWALYLDYKNIKHQRELLKSVKRACRSKKNYSLIFSNQDYEHVCKTSLGKYLNKNKTKIKYDGHYILKNIDHFNLKSSISSRLLRSYKKTLPHIKTLHWLPVNEIDLNHYLLEMRKKLFTKNGVLAPTVEQLMAQLKSKHKGLDFWVCRCQGEVENINFQVEIVVAVLKYKNKAEAKFLHYLDDRHQWKKSWLSPGTACHIKIIQQLQTMGVKQYNLGTFHKQTQKLNEYKSQFLKGAQRQHKVVIGRIN